MSTIFLKSLKGYRWSILVMALLLMGVGFLIAASYESFGPENSELLGEQMPKGLSAFLKAEGNLLLAAGPRAYLAIGFRHPLFLILLSAFAIATASGALAKEIENRTILMLLARPVKRYHLVLSRGLGSSVGLALLVAALLVGIFIGVRTEGLGDRVPLGTFMAISFNALCLALAIAGYSYLFSALSNEGGRAIFLSTALTVVFFVLDFIAGLFDVLEPLGLASVFHYHNPVSLAIEGSFPWLHVGVLLAGASATFGAALLVFQRRDIAA